MKKLTELYRVYKGNLKPEYITKQDYEWVMNTYSKGTELFDFLYSKLKYPCYNKNNQYSIKSEQYPFNEDSVKLFNEIYKKIYYNDIEFVPIKRTPKGCISCMNIGCCEWDVTYTNSCIRMTILYYGVAWCIKLGGNALSEETGVTGTMAFKEFCNICKQFNIDINDYAIDNGREVKEQIESPKIYIDEMFYNTTLENVHHIDINSAWPSAIIKAKHPLAPVFNYLYEHRKENNNYYKMIMNACIGYFQSTKCCGAKWSNISKLAINDTNRVIEDLISKLEANDNIILGCNTDGIWYAGKIYHDDNEGINIGQWKNDHINCKFRAKSNGAYEFIENGKYHPVVRGRTNLDAIKDRVDWEWGDIYKSNVISYTFEEGQGVIEND